MKQLRRLALVTLGVAGIAVGGAQGQPSSAISAERHSGTITTVDSRARTLVVEELVEEGRPQQLRVLIAPDAPVILSERIPDAEVFRDSRLAVDDIRAGDFVTVDVEKSGAMLVARSITVTLRGGSR